MRKPLLILFFTLLLLGCNSTPSNVIDDDDMVDVMMDMHKAEAYMEMNSGKFDNDSLKKTMKQSVLKKHGYTQADFDTSLVWYGHHIDRYVKVYDKVIQNLTDEKKALAKDDRRATVVAQGVGSRKRYKNTGDTADVWAKDRTWMFLPGLGQNLVTFDMRPDRQGSNGDRYELSMKLCNPRSGLKVYLGIDYVDGSTAFIYRTTSFEGWNKYTLQSDTTRNINRVYGYIQYTPSMGEVAFVDSIEILRTHLDRTTYSMINAQKWIGRKSLIHKAEPKEDVVPVLSETMRHDTVQSNRPGQKTLRPINDAADNAVQSRRPRGGLGTPQIPGDRKMPQPRK